MSSNEIKNIVDNILKEDKNIELTIPLKDLIWTITAFSYLMKNIEEEIFNDSIFKTTKIEKLINQKEYYACRRDELARLITQYTDFDTQRIWNEVDSIFVEYK